MNHSFKYWAGSAIAVLLAAGFTLPADAQTRRHERPLTITPRHGDHHGTGIEVRNGGNEIIAWGGFSANGYGPGRLDSEQARRAFRNEQVRVRTSGIYGYGLDGLGGTGFDDDLHSGYDNPNYGNAYNSYVGYNGVPTNFAFGPAFANRSITDREDDENDVLPSASPRQLGYAGAGETPSLFDTDD